MEFGEVSAFALNYTRKKARLLVSQYRFPPSDVEDCQQEMLQDLVHRLPRYNPARSPPNAFVVLVVNNRFASMIGQRMSPSREHFRDQASINEPLCRDGRLAERGDTLYGQTCGSVRCEFHSDLGDVLAGLPPPLRAVWDLRVQGFTFEEIAVQLGLARPTVSERWAKVCQHIKETDLDAYLDEI